MDNNKGNKIFVSFKGEKLKEEIRYYNITNTIYEVDILKNKFELNKIYKDMKKSIKNIKIFDLLARNVNRIVFIEKHNKPVHVTYREFHGDFYTSESNTDTIRDINIILENNTYLLIRYEAADTSLLNDISTNFSLNSLPGKVIRKWCMENKHRPESQYILDTYFSYNQLNKFSYYNIIIDENGKIKIIRDLEKSPKLKDYGD